MRVARPGPESNITWVSRRPRPAARAPTGPPSDTTRYSSPNDDRDAHATRASHTSGSPKNAGCAVHDARLGDDERVPLRIRSGAERATR